MTADDLIDRHGREHLEAAVAWWASVSGIPNVRRFIRDMVAVVERLLAEFLEREGFIGDGSKDVKPAK